MYMVRKRFMYWQVPTVTKVPLRKEKGEAFCFVPAKRVKRVKKSGNHMVQRLLTEYSSSLFDRRVTLHIF